MYAQRANLFMVLMIMGLQQLARCVLQLTPTVFYAQLIFWNVLNANQGLASILQLQLQMQLIMVRVMLVTPIVKTAVFMTTISAHHVWLASTWIRLCIIA